MEQETKQKQSKPQKKPLFIELLDGSFLTKRSFLKTTPFLLFLCLLALINIANNQHADSLNWKITKMEKEVRELRAMSVAIASELMYNCNYTEVQKKLDQVESKLKTSNHPPYKIEIKEDDFPN